MSAARRTANFAIRANTIKPTGLSIPRGGRSKNIAMVTGRDTRPVITPPTITSPSIRAYLPI